MANADCSSHDLSPEGREILTAARAEALAQTVEAWIAGNRWAAEARLDDAHSYDLALRASAQEVR